MSLRFLFPFTVISILILVIPLNLASSAEEASKRLNPQRLFKNLIGDDGRIYACSGRTFYSFEGNGSIVWALQLNYTCNSHIAPVNGGSRKIYLVAEDRLLKIHPEKVGTSEAAVEIFFGQVQGPDGPGEIIGISVSVSSSCVIINVKNRGLLAYRLHGQLIWSAGPILYRHGYRQGCRTNMTECYFTSAPAIDQCEASIYISNNLGELYSLSVRGSYFKWIQDLSSYGNTFTITSGNNGLVYVTIPEKTLILAVDVIRGDILWQGKIGPVSSADYTPIVDINGWISVGSLDGFLYSFSPTGNVERFPKSAGLNSVIQVSPIVDCSGYGVYISRTELEEKTSQTIGGYTYITGTKPRNTKFILLAPASGSIYFSENDPSKSLFNLSQTDLRHFLLDEKIVLAFFAVSRNGNPLTCRSTRQKIAASCSLVKPKNMSVYMGNERTIVLFLVLESILMVILAILVRYCCIFWEKRKLQSQDLGKFLEKRRSLRRQKKAFDRTISQLEQKASEEAVANEVLEKLGDLVKERHNISRKLSTTYSLGRDGEKSRSKSLLPLYDEKSRSHSFQDSKKGSVTIFHSLGDSTSLSGDSSSSYDENLPEDKEVVLEAKMKGKARVEIESYIDDEIRPDDYFSPPSALRGFVNPLFLGRSVREIEEVKGNASLRRRSMSIN